MTRVNSVKLASLSPTQLKLLKKTKQYVIRHAPDLKAFALDAGKKPKKVFGLIRIQMEEQTKVKKKTMDMVFSSCSLYSFVFDKIIRPAREEEKKERLERQESIGQKTQGLQQNTENQRTKQPEINAKNLLFLSLVAALVIILLLIIIL